MFDPNDDVEQLSSSETLDLLEVTDVAYINDELFDLAMVTDKIDIEEMKEVFQELLSSSPMVRKLYIDTIGGME